MSKVVLALAMTVGLAATVAAQDGFSHGRVRYVEPSVSLQREAETSSEEAGANAPFLPGDRVWSDGSGRAEFQFPDGLIIRLDSRGKLDYLGHDESGRSRVVLKLWSGGIYVHARDRSGTTLDIETPGGLVEVEGGGVVRVDADSGETRVSVWEGEASLASAGRRVSLGAGERSYARGSESPEPPRRFDARGGEDEFDAWDRSRQGQDGWADGGRNYLPEELGAYSGELASNGVWRYEASVGNVWQPYVSAGWSPYVNGRWTWTAYGWTWVPGESWGWAPFHYGRWGRSASFGWYWIPGRSWGPAWVSWASGGDYVGWCPLGYRDRPLYGHGSYGRSAYRGTGSPGWNFVHRNEMGMRDLGRRRRDQPGDANASIRVADSPQARPTRDLREFRVVDGGGRMVPRAGRTRPTPADAVPEPRVDRTTTLPLPRPGSDLRPTGRDRAPVRDGARATDVRATRRRAAEDAPPAPPPPPLPAPDSASPVATPRTETRERGATRRTRPAEREADHEVLGRFFRPLNDPKPQSESSGGGEAREGARSRRGGGDAPRGDSERPPAYRPPPRSERSNDGGGRESGESGRTTRTAPREENTPRTQPRTERPERSESSARPKPQPQSESSSSSGGGARSRSRERGR